jgi:hypothetical protein
MMRLRYYQLKIYNESRACCCPSGPADLLRRCPAVHRGHADRLHRRLQSRLPRLQEGRRSRRIRHRCRPRLHEILQQDATRMLALHLLVRQGIPTPHQGMQLILIPHIILSLPFAPTPRHPFHETLALPPRCYSSIQLADSGKNG